MNENELRDYLTTLTTDQMVEMIVQMVANEADMRKELDSLNKIIR